MLLLDIFQIDESKLWWWVICLCVFQVLICIGKNNILSSVYAPCPMMSTYVICWPPLWFQTWGIWLSWSLARTVLGKCDTFVYMASNKDIHYFTGNYPGHICEGATAFFGWGWNGLIFKCEIANSWINYSPWQSLIYSRFLVVDNEADQAFVSWRPVVLPRQPNGMARCDVGLELQDVTFTCLNRRILTEAPAWLAKGDVGEILTAGSFAIITEVSLLLLLRPARFFPHLVDFWHAQLWVQAKEETSMQNCQVVLVPVPQVLQVLVVDGGECVYAENEKKKKEGKSYKYLNKFMKTKVSYRSFRGTPKAPHPTPPILGGSVWQISSGLFVWQVVCTGRY